MKRPGAAILTSRVTAASYARDESGKSGKEPSR